MAEGAVGALAKAHAPPAVIRDAIEEQGVRFMISFDIGRSYYIETFSRYLVGRVREVTGTEVILEGAAWVAYTGRLHTFLSTGKADGLEVEPIGEWHLPLMYVSGKSPWKFPLFEEAI